MPLCQAPQGFRWANQRCRGKRFPRLHSSRPAPRGSPQSWSSCIRLQHFNKSDILEDGDGDNYAIGIIWQLTGCRVDCSWRHVQVTCSRGVGRIAVIFWKYDNIWGNKLASLEATLVRNSAHLLTYLLTHSLTGVKCRATSVAKKTKRWSSLSFFYDLQNTEMYV